MLYALPHLLRQRKSFRSLLEYVLTFVFYRQSEMLTPTFAGGEMHIHDGHCRKQVEGYINSETLLDSDVHVGRQSESGLS